MRRALRLLMIILLIFLCGSGLSFSRTESLLHEWCGMFLVVCVLLHLACNRKWFIRLFKGKYNCYRGFNTVIDMLLIAIIVLTAVSGMMISGYVFSFLDLGGTAWGRRMHLAGTAWLFLLSGIHFGMHMRNDKRNVLLYIVAACGIAAFAISRFYERLFLISEFAYVLSVSPWIIYLIHAFIFSTFMCVGNEIRLLVVKKNEM